MTMPVAMAYPLISTSPGKTILRTCAVIAAIVPAMKIGNERLPNIASGLPDPRRVMLEMTGIANEQVAYRKSMRQPR